MPPPPPPSKSYNLKIVCSSDEEEEEEEEQAQQQQRRYRRPSPPSPVTATTAAPTAKKTALNAAAIAKRNQLFREQLQLQLNVAAAPPVPAAVTHISSSSDDDEQAPEIVETKKKKKNGHKNRRKKKKKNRNSHSLTDTHNNSDTHSITDNDNDNNSDTHSITDTDITCVGAPVVGKHVQFTHINIREYERCLGTDVVPFEGGWPLGLGNHYYAAGAVHDNTDDEKEETAPETKGAEAVSVDEFEKEKQQRLRHRWLALDTVESNTTTQSPEKQKTPPPPPCEEPRIFETRQWDYKYTKNPLFSILKETARMNLLLANSPHSCDGGGAPSSPSKNTHKRSPSASSSSSSKKNTHTRNRSRSGSFSDHHNPRTRSKSFAENFDDKYDQMTVHHVRNDLEQIRNRRNATESTGCTCRKLAVYLPPQGGGGKKAQHRRMNERKVKDELRKRGLLPTQPPGSGGGGNDRHALELLLINAVEQEPCCSNNECPCVRNGIECQATSCTCWYESHQLHKKGQSTHATEEPSVQDIRSRCGNPNGVYTTNFEEIAKHRDQYLLCRPTITQKSELTS